MQAWHVNGDYKSRGKKVRANRIKTAFFISHQIVSIFLHY